MPYFFQSCLKFLHQEAKLSHEDVRNSVYVTEGGDWKLAGFEKSGIFKYFFAFVLKDDLIEGNRT